MMKMMMVQVTQRSVLEDAPLGHIVPMVSAFVIQVIIMRMMMRIMSEGRPLEAEERRPKSVGTIPGSTKYVSHNDDDDHDDENYYDDDYNE